MAVLKNIFLMLAFIMFGAALSACDNSNNSEAEAPADETVLEQAVTDDAVGAETEMAPAEEAGDAAGEEAAKPAE